MLIQLRYREAAARFAVAAEQTPASEPDTRRGYRKRQAHALYHQGDERGDNSALAEAIRIYRDLLAAYSHEREPLDWARTQHNLGNTLQILGERESDSGRLQAALAAYHAALQERTRERTPLQWAMTQNNLGNALRILGERESDSRRLHEALAAFRAALQERIRERTPLDWAMTQHNLGTILRILGEWESDSERLEAARGHIQRAWQIYQDAGLEQDDEYFRQRLERLDRLLEGRRADQARDGRHPPPAETPLAPTLQRGSRLVPTEEGS
nr:tetratricopeptide repeat protein [Candidatus Thiosymbion oneisti]